MPNTATVIELIETHPVSRTAATKFQDDTPLLFGSGSTGVTPTVAASDFSMAFDGTQLEILPVAADTGAVNFGDGTTDADVKVFLGASTDFVRFDVGNGNVVFDNAELAMGDADEILFGDASDVSMAWDGTNFLVLPVADDTGIFKVGDGTTDMDFRVTLGAAGDYAEFDVGTKALEIVGDARIDLSSATLASANTDGGVIKAGTSGARVIEDTASMKFMSFYWDCGATSGGSTGLYNRLYVTGAGGSGDAGRFFCTVEDVAGATARGAHISLSFGASGSVTGLGAALEATLHIPTTAGMAGTNYAIKAAINADGAASDPVGATTIAFIGIVGQGDATGLLDLDTDGHLLDVTGMTAATGVTNLLSSTSLTELPANVGLRVKINGALYYIPCVAAAGWN